MDITIKPNEPQLVALTVDLTDKELFDGVVKCYTVCQLTERGFGLTISGYDLDPRELYEISEVIEFCRRLLNLGFLSILEPSTQSPEFKDEDSCGLGLGALEIWMIAHNYVKDGVSEITKDMMNRFMADLHKSNNWLTNIMSNNNKVREVQDGQHRLYYKWN